MMLKKPVVKKILIIVAVLAAYIVFCESVTRTSIKLMNDTWTHHHGEIEELVGYKKDDDGGYVFCVKGKVRSIAGEHQIAVSKATLDAPKYIDAVANIHWVDTLPENVQAGCASDVNKKPDSRVSLDPKQKTTIVIASVGNGPVINIVIKNISEHHATPEQERLEKILDALEPLTLPYGFCVLLYAFTLGGGIPL
jgi:hypothetical protein